MGVSYFDQYKENRKFIYLFMMVTAVLIELAIIFIISYSPGLKYFKFTLQLSSFGLFFTAIHFWLIAPLLSKRVGVIYFFIVLLISVTFTTSCLFILVETGVFKYPDIIYPEFLPLRMKIAFYICCSLLIFFGTRFIYLFLNTFQVSDKRFQYLNDSHINEINSLKMQNNPVFLQDSLNKLSNLIYNEQFELASKLNSDIFYILNKQLKYTQKDYITLQEEIDWQNQYLNIYISLLKQKFAYEIQVEDEELLLQPIPPLLLQSALEVYLNEIQTHESFVILKILVSDIQQNDSYGLSFLILLDAQLPSDKKMRFNNLEKRVSLLNKVGRYKVDFQYDSNLHLCTLQIIENA